MTNVDIYYSAARAAFQRQASDTFLGRAWVHVMVLRYDPETDPNVPASVRGQLYDDRQW